MKATHLPLSTTLEIESAEDFATALDMMHPLALGTFDRDVAYREAMPSSETKSRIKVQINREPEAELEPDPADTSRDRYRTKRLSWVAGYVYVCSTGWIYHLVIAPEAEAARVATWHKIQGVVLHGERKDRL